jgi:hypothetical protein
MFGFIEEKLAILLAMPYEPFTLNGGGVAAMITRPYFVRIFHALNKIWEEEGDSEELMPLDKESDIHGMRIIIHKYYYDDRVLDGLTTGAIKETESYAAIKEEGDGTQRFTVENFENRIRELYQEQPMPRGEEEREEVRRPEVHRIDPIPHNPNPTHRPRPTLRERLAEYEAIVSDTVEELEKDDMKSKPSKKEESQEDIGKKFEKLAYVGCHFKDISGSKFKICRLKYTDNLEESFLIDMANQLQRHIIIGDDRRYLLEAKKVISSKSDIDRSFLIIATNPSSLGAIDLTNTVDKTKSIVFGKEINDLYIIKGHAVNDAISRIKNDNELNSEEKQKQINAILAEQKNSPYAKYDKIYKDTATNVVFALQEKNFITLMFNLYDNNKIAAIVLKEIVRRFDGTIPYSELVKIDAEYQAVLEKGNCDEYVKFVMDSSSSVIRQLKKAYEEAKTAYEDYLTKAMESGKLCSKYMEQIDSFNESEQQRKIKEKAYEEYMAVKTIPKIKTVFIKDENVHIYTDNLYAKDDRSKKMHDIGTFHITVGMHSNNYDTNSTVIIKNTKHQIVAFNGQNMQAPHVFQEGYICHGTLATGMANAYKKRDLYQLVFQLILFLQQANTDDAAGKYVNCWPEVSEEIIKIQEQKLNEKQPAVVEFINKPEDKHFDEVLAEAIPV